MQDAVLSIESFFLRADHPEMLSVFVISPVRLLRDGIAELLGRANAHRQLHTMANGEDAIAHLAAGAACVVLLDAAMRDAAVIARRLARHERVRAVIAFAVAEDVANQVALAECGVKGYVGHDGSLDDLVSATDAALRGELHCPPTLAAALARRLANVREGRAERIEALSHREREIVQLVDEGMSNKEIAGRLHIEMATVKNHIHHILHKLGVQRRGEAAAALRRWQAV